MTTQFENRISFFEPNGFGARHDPIFQTRRPTILVGIQRDVCPPVNFGNTRLERMRIIVVAPEHAAELFEAEPTDLDPDSLPEVLPLLPPTLGLTRTPQFQPRSVLGEILRGENGAFYERFGNRIRPLRQLVSGPNGEVLEIADLGDAPPRLHARVPAPSATEDVAEPETQTPQSENETAPPQARSPFNGETDGGRDEANRESTKTSFRSLFPEPGQWRVLRLGDFKPMLVPQLVHPERLRDSHRLPCYVQVFEVSVAQRMEALAEALFGDASATSQLRPLTLAVVQQLQLAPLLPAPARRPRPIPRPPELFLPGDRVFYLEVANDPTDETRSKNPTSVSDQPHQSRSSRGNAALTKKAEAGNQHSALDDATEALEVNGSTAAHQARSSRGIEAQTEKSEIANRKLEIHQGLPTSAATSETRPQAGVILTTQRSQPSTEAAAPLPAEPSTVLGPTILKTSIPAQFLKPWEFRFSREEVLYDLNRGPSFWGRLRAGLRRLLGGWVSSSEVRKWQVLAAGRNLDEQLWAVRPPRGGVSHPFIRAWVERTLAAAGYDPRIMLTEWEIFWGRKET